MDGASPFQQFWYLSMPMLLGILSVLFLLRFIWTFNKFDDIFLLTGGNAGTRTLTVNVYEQAFAISNIGAGCSRGGGDLRLPSRLLGPLLPVHQPGGRAMSALFHGGLSGAIIGALWTVVAATTAAVVMSFATGRRPFRPSLLLSLLFGALARAWHLWRLNRAYLVTGAFWSRPFPADPPHFRRGLAAGHGRCQSWLSKRRPGRDPFRRDDRLAARTEDPRPAACRHAHPARIRSGGRSGS